MAFSQRVADYVCVELAKGRSLRAIARDKDKIEGMPDESNLREWAVTDPELGAQYARARLVGNESDFERLDEWANEKPPRLENGAVDNGWNNWNRTRIDTTKWSLAKRQPAKYGDKLELGGEIGMKNLSDDQVKAQTLALMAKIGLDAAAAAQGSQDAPGPTD